MGRIPIFTVKIERKSTRFSPGFTWGYSIQIQPLRGWAIFDFLELCRIIQNLSGFSPSKARPNPFGIEFE